MFLPFWTFLNHPPLAPSKGSRLQSSLISIKLLEVLGLTWETLLFPVSVQELFQPTRLARPGLGWGSTYALIEPTRSAPAEIKGAVQHRLVRGGKKNKIWAVISPKQQSLVTLFYHVRANNIRRNFLQLDDTFRSRFTSHCNPDTI